MFRLTFASLVLLCAAIKLPGQPVVISQVYGGGGNSGATLKNDFIELFNRGAQAVSLSGWSVQYTSSAGETWQVTPLNGSIGPGRYFLVQQAAGAGGTLDLPTPDATGMLALSGTAGKVALSRTAAPLTGALPVEDVADLVGYGSANGFEGSGPAGGLSNTTAAIRRGNGCQDTGNNGSDFQVAVPAPRNSATPATDCNAPAPLPEEIRISQVQGSATASPFAGRLVKVRGIVTGRRSNGIWLESRPEDNDNNPATSEGVFVFASPLPANAPAIGNVVDVTGTVTEFRPASDPESESLTEIVDPQFSPVGTASLPPVTALPVGGDWERFEGMRVSATLTTVSGTLGSVAETTASATSSGIFFGVLTGTSRAFLDPVLGVDFRRIRVDTNDQGGQPVDITSGVRVTAAGPLDYAFRTYTIVSEPGVMVSGQPLTAKPLPAAAANEFRVASMNVERLFDTADDPSTQDPVLTAAAYQKRIDRAARVIREVLGSPEIIGIQEIENLASLQALATAAGDYQAYLIEGNDVGGIDVGLLAKRSRVQVTDAVQEGKDVRQVDNSILNDRPPLAVRLRIDNYAMTVIVVHQRSLIDVGTPNVDRKRRGQAEFLRDLVATRSRVGEQVMVVGDHNMFTFDPLLEIVKSGGGLLNLTDTVALSESYSYVQDGTAQTLDHMLLAPSLKERYTRFQYARVNADFPDTHRNASLERISDHDIPVAYFVVDPAGLRATPAGVTNAATNLTSPITPLEILAIYGRNLSNARVLFDGAAADLIYAGQSQVNVVVPASVQGRATTSVTVEVQGAVVSSFALPVVEAEPGIFTQNNSGKGAAAVLNQDFSLNTAATPADRGSAIMIFATGGGTLPSTAQVRIGGVDAVVEFSGQAPGLVPGALQVNARIPQAVQPGANVPVSISIAGRPSAPGVTIAVR